MNFKRYNESDNSWTDSHYIKKTDTDIITTLPATIYPLAQTATIELKGNTVQNGTPTPDNPVPVVGVGDLDNGNYKIPISSAGQTIPVYLGEVQSVRQIGKYIVTGNEDISDYDSQYSRFIIQFADITSFGVRITPCLSSDYIGIFDGRPIAQVPNNAIYTGSAGTHSIYVKTTAYTDKSSFISYLQSRFAANDPIVIYFALSTPETGAANEPLQKIGDYADSISGISIPTTAGTNMLDVLTTLKPSEVTASFNGWHPVSAAHERSGGSWT